MLKEPPNQSFSKQAMTEAVELQDTHLSEAWDKYSDVWKYYEIPVKKTRPRFNPFTASFYHKQLWNS